MKHLSCEGCFFCWLSNHFYRLDMLVWYTDFNIRLKPVFCTKLQISILGRSEYAEKEQTIIISHDQFFDVLHESCFTCLC